MRMPYVHQVFPVHGPYHTAARRDLSYLGWYFVVEVLGVVEFGTQSRRIWA